MSRPRSHYGRGEARRAALLEAAVEVIAAQGLEGVTHRAVAEAAGMPLSTTSYFFRSMDELIGAAVTAIADDVLSTVDTLVTDVVASLGRGQPPDEEVARLLDAVTSPRSRQVLVQFEAFLGTTRRPELVDAVRRMVEAYERAAAAVLVALGAEDPHRSARVLVAVLDGFALQRLAFPRPDDVELARTTVEAMVPVLLQGSPARRDPASPGS